MSGLWKLLYEHSNTKEGFIKSTEAMDAGDGCVIQVTTQLKNPDGSYAIAKALTFAPDLMICEVLNEDKSSVIGYKLMWSKDMQEKDEVISVVKIIIETNGEVAE